MQRLGSGSGKLFNHTQPAEATGINEAEFATRREFQNRMRVFFDWNIRGRNAKTAGHSEMNNPLGSFSRRPVRRSQIENDMLAHPSYARDGLRIECGNDLFSGRLQRLRLRPEPNGFDGLAGNAFIQATRDGFDFG